MSVFDGIIGGFITTVAALFAAYIAQRTGHLQTWIMGEEHDLNLLLAMPKVGTDITAEMRYENGRAYPPVIFLVTTIYNEGKFPAQKLHGNWKLTIPNSSTQYTIPVYRDAIGKTPYKMDEFRLAESAAWSNNSPQFGFHVDIDFDYSGFRNQKPDHYSAKYRYDRESGQMVRITE